MDPPPINLPCHVLVVEDELTIALNVMSYLEALGCTVDVAYDGGAALSRLEQGAYDVVVLDVGLPRLDGIQVLEQMRARLTIATPVIVLTARAELDAKLRSFALGADDHLTKPFVLAELAARIGAVHRRRSGSLVQEVLRAGPLSMDLRTRSVKVGETPVRLMPRSMILLERLMRDPGRVIARTELESLLWPEHLSDGDPLRGQIHLLRKALSDAGFDAMETVHGVGYRLKIDE